MRSRGSREREADALTPGERVWYLSGAAVHVAEVTKDRVVLEGDPLAFHMYTIRLGDREKDSVQRGYLFRAPAEKAELIAELETTEDLARYYRAELESQDDGHVPGLDDEC